MSSKQPIDRGCDHRLWHGKSRAEFTRRRSKKAGETRPTESTRPTTPRRMATLLGWSIALSVALVAISGCGQTTDVAESDGESTAIVKTSERGPVTMTVTASKGKISIADRLELTIDVTAEDGVEVHPPAFGEQLGQFAIRDFREFPEEVTSEGRRWRQVYTLDVFVSGTYTIPALTANFTDRRNGDDAIVESSVSSEPFEIEVTSLLEGEFDPTAFRDVKGPLSLPMSRTWTWVWWSVGGIVSVAVIVVVIVWLVRRGRRPMIEPVIPPHEWAFDQLQMLIDDKLIEQERVHEFYFRLSMIVRRYIELRFHLMAPERTTEEFLREMQRSDALPAAHREALTQFLLACDMVKYALYLPKADEIENVFDTARDFVTQTAGASDDVEVRAA
jgi:hypothetical protein